MVMNSESPPHAGYEAHFNGEVSESARSGINKGRGGKDHSGRVTDNDVIEHLDCKTRAPSDSLRVGPDISFTSRRLARRMVVHQHKSLSRLSDD